LVTAATLEVTSLVAADIRGLQFIDFHENFEVARALL
jgi:hypothetical protein